MKAFTSPRDLFPSLSVVYTDLSLCLMPKSGCAWISGQNIGSKVGRKNQPLGCMYYHIGCLHYLKVVRNSPWNSFLLSFKDFRYQKGNKILLNHQEFELAICAKAQTVVCVFIQLKKVEYPFT